MFSNGILVLAGLAALLIVAFNANVTRLIQLYILGVFLSFTLSQTGMVRHWAGELRGAAEPGERRAIRRKQLVNGTGAVATGLVFVIVLVTKFAAGRVDRRAGGADDLPVMKAIAMHYRHVDPGAASATRRRDASGPGPRGRAGVEPARADPPRARLRAGHAPGDAPRGEGRGRGRGRRARRPSGQERGVPVPLVVIESPYRETVRPVQLYVRQLRRDYPGDVISIIIPEYVVGHWWENLLHNQTALRLKARLLFEPWIR